MEFTHPYIIVRVGLDGKAQVLHSASKIKDARYYLNYISEPGDVLMLTPSHPKYLGSGSPVYNAHLVKRGKTEYDEDSWRALMSLSDNHLAFM